MDTMSHAGVTDQTGGDAGGGQTGKEARALLLDRYLAADFPWYGLDEGWTGRRWPGSVCEGGEGLEYGTLGHGDSPSRRPGDPTPRKFVAVVTMPRRERRRSGDGAGMLEATSMAGAASVAGVGLLSDTWQWELDRDMRQEWVEQQTYLAWELADNLDGDGWTGLALPVDGVPNRFRFRESEYGWVMAGEAAGVYLGVYGHGVSAYDLGLSVVRPTAYV
ncbi:hypothetical protein LO772_21370 [Yinghuangia sp. ASG 101]|uniref:hypothetical protein n=1 Tax=Yinghuangia sp. ASG 101 TaxID=2896848 RepID=UPI001E3224BF|nr:hypothetical protein [Yinghuangia sp. ASG 101]UGQ09485.1 hypothetical protein LO772_21370 [Yinghuangia sp. ASG 101]